MFSEKWKISEEVQGDDFLEENKEFESLRVVRERNTEKYILMAGGAKVFSVATLKVGEGQWQNLERED